MEKKKKLAANDQNDRRFMFLKNFLTDPSYSVGSDSHIHQCYHSRTYIGLIYPLHFISHNPLQEVHVLRSSIKCLFIQFNPFINLSLKANSGYNKYMYFEVDGVTIFSYKNGFQRQQMNKMFYIHSLNS